MAMAASKLIQPSTAASVGGIYPGRRRRKLARSETISLKSGPANGLKIKSRSFDESPSGFIRRAAEQGSGLFPLSQGQEQEEDEKTVAQIKEELYEAVKGINRGIFGVTSARKSEIEHLVKLLNCRNPTADPTGDLDKFRGCWKLIYSTITILGSKRTKLGLRDFVSVGDILQHIDISQGKSVHVIKFNVRGLNLIDGELKIDASFKIVSGTTVDVTYESSTIMPDQLMSMFRQNYDLLLGVFNPEGRFEILYLDGDLQIGREEKGNIIVLKRTEIS
ncbi:PREDICTED: probable plastid-lipid-associated protein 7, chloroplastic [Tarenaya hassleriana]|uniref:probable plastid-lipid-associated protein 7, chloroplastic n=1 Tax=Tarenaya hassleriana TaxID=28532 RepID=UPI00053CA4CB|nr:PREDICTED: probable plastid-lipid-associated protein 7, chloroplastic [Tarenaya hassleriana]